MRLGRLMFAPSAKNIVFGEADPPEDEVKRYG